MLSDLSLKNTNVFFKTRQIPATVSGGSGGGWPAGAAAPPCRNPKLIFLNFFLFYSFLLLPHYTFSDLKPPNTNDMGLDLNEKERRKVILFLCYFRRCLYVGLRICDDDLLC